MAATVGQVLEFLNTIAPMNTAESYDNVGLLTGNSAENITGIACCLDITQEIIDEALSKRKRRSWAVSLSYLTTR